MKYNYWSHLWKIAPYLWANFLDFATIAQVSLSSSQKHMDQKHKEGLDILFSKKYKIIIIIIIIKIIKQKSKITTKWPLSPYIRLRVVCHFSSGIVERAKRKHAWKSPHASKGVTWPGERKMRDYRQSPSFWTYALLSQHKTLIGSSMEICQHLSKTCQLLSILDIITIYRTNN